MKRSICYKYILLAIITLMITGLESCVQDDFITRGDSGDYDGISLRIKLPEQKQVNPMSRAFASDFDVVNDLNIFVADETGNIKKRLYLDVSALTLDQKNTIDTDVTVTPKKDGNGYVEYTIDFSATYWSGVSVDKSKFYAVANWGSEMTEVVDVITDEGSPAKAALNTINDLKSIKVSELKGEGNVHSSVPTPCAMYGEENSNRTEITDPDDSSKKIKVVTIEMKRLAAMITLAMDGSGLSNNIEISVDSVVLRNVPKSCTLGPGNRPTSNANISKYGDFKGGTVFSSGSKLIGSSRKSLGVYSNDSQFQTTIGGHYSPDVNGNISNVTGTFVQPLFLFENKQPDGNSGGQAGHEDTHKRPLYFVGTTTTVGDNASDIARYNETGVCSYIEVYAKYTQYNGTTTDVTHKGTASWRFFLGRDAFSNFDVERNTNYRITLKLNNTGIGERDYSWRVDADLKQGTDLNNKDNVVGGGGEAFCVEFNGNLSQLFRNGLKLQLTDGTSNDPPFIYIFTKPSSSLEWAAVTTGNTHWEKAVVNDKQFWFYVRPLLPDDSEYTGNERKCVLQFQKNNGSLVGTVSFTQYRPVTFSVKSSDLTTYPNDEDLKGAVRILKEYYKVDFDNNFSEFKFYADRVDREAMPWGFTGIPLDFNRDTGFENVYHLIKPLEGNKGDNCQMHVDYAAHYLPTGKGYRENPKDIASVIDYSNGSCMVHAAMENYFQQFYPNPNGYGDENDPNVSPKTMASVTLDKVFRPGSPDDPTPEDRRYSWCVPSVAGCQLVEKLDRFYKRHGITDRGFDPKYPITPWVSYWTSNAATKDMAEYYPSELNINGENRSFVYQFDMGLDEKDYKFGNNGNQVGNDIYPAYFIVPRSTPVRYRLLNIRPNSISGSGATN